MLLVRLLFRWVQILVRVKVTKRNDHMLIVYLKSDHVEVAAMWSKLRTTFQKNRAADRRAKKSGAALDDEATLSRWPHMSSLMWLERFLRTRK